MGTSTAHTSNPGQLSHGHTWATVSLPGVEWPIPPALEPKLEGRLVLVDGVYEGLDVPAVCMAQLRLDSNGKATIKQIMITDEGGDLFGFARDKSGRVGVAWPANRTGLILNQTELEQTWLAVGERMRFVYGAREVVSERIDQIICLSGQKLFDDAERAPNTPEIRDLAERLTHGRVVFLLNRFHRASRGNIPLEEM